jgi:hypothetical protein
MRTVLARGAGVRTIDTIDLGVTLTGGAAAWDRGTAWMLRFLRSGLEDHHLRIQNFKVASFENPRTAATPEEGHTQISKVRLEGQHVGAHRDACQRIIDGQRLREVELLLRFDNLGDLHHLTVRIEVATDHATITTGAGQTPEAVVRNVHTQLVSKVRRALDEELGADSLGGLPGQIAERAQEASPPDEADLFAPDADGAS